MRHPRMKISRWIRRVIPVILLCTAPLSAQTPSADSFAEFLRGQGEYYRAVTEYLRLLHEAERDDPPDSLRRADLARRIARCYYDGADYERCLSWHAQSASLLRADPSAHADVFLLSGKSLCRLGRWRQAADMLTWSAIGAGETQYAEKQFVLGVALLHARDTAAASQAWTPILQNAEWGKAASVMQRGLPGLADLPYRSPAAAGLLSAIIPGAGYLYTGRPATALAALLINGLLAWAVTDAARSGQYGVAAAAGFIGLGWYGGNILGSVNAAHAANDAAYRAYVQRLLAQSGAGQNFEER